MTNRLLTCGCILVFALCAAAVAGAQESREADPISVVQLAKGEHILVMRAEDYFTGSRIIEGTGGALMQSVHNALAELELSPQAGSYAAVVNALEECQENRCDYLLLPRLKRYTSRGAMRAKVRLTLDLIDATSGSVIASCDEARTGWRPKGERSQEMMRPAVEACLATLIAVETDTDRAVTAVAGEFMVVPYNDFWLLQREEARHDDDLLVDLMLESLQQADCKAERGPSELERKELFVQARKMRCNTILTVGVGLVWTRHEQPPDDTPPQLVFSLVDVTSEENLQTVIVESLDRGWAEEDYDLLPVLVQTAMGRLLGHTVHEGAVPEGVTLSLLEPATVIDDFHLVVPRALRDKRPPGDVLVSFIVDEHGDVLDPRIVKSVPELDKRVLKAVRRLRFLPARRDGEVCPIHMTMKYWIDREW